MNESVNKTEDLWNPYKELLKVVNNHLCGHHENLSTAELENALRKHKQNFYTLLQNPPKSAKSREELKKGMIDGITVRGIGHQILSKDLYQEAIILSDMYDLNEYVALDLLCTAQIQMPYYPGLPRGLVAILLYYDGRKSVVSTLRMLVQARKGVLWSLDVKPEVERFITFYTDQLMENGLFDKIFDFLAALDLSKEIEKLQQNVALGGPRHRKQVTDLFVEIRQILAEIVFLWSAQCGLPKQPTISLINYLRHINLEEDATGKLDNVTLYLEMALLYAMDLSVLHTREDGEEVVLKLPIFSDVEYIEMLLTELSPMKAPWASEGLHGTAMFALAVTLACIRLVPHNEHLQSVMEYEDTFVNTAIDMKVFQFLMYRVMENELFYTEQFILKRVHHLIADFIVQMYSKVKELRIKADETARTTQVYALEGLEAPANLPQHFELFLLTVAKLYNKDPLNEQLMLEYWCPQEINSTQSFQHRAPVRSVSLFKFVRLAGDMVPPTLFVPYLSMLGSLSSCPEAARYCFNLLKQSGPGYSNTISWDHFFMSLSQYYSNLRQETPSINDTVYRHRTPYHKGITPQEIAGLQSVLKLIKTVGGQDDFSRLALCEHPGWAPLSVLLGLVSCSVPLSLKAEMLLTLAELSKSPETAAQMWNNLEASQILPTIPSTSSYQPRGIQTELDEIESRSEEYPLTRAILRLFDVLTDFGIPRTLGAGPRKPGFDPYLTFIINSVFLKFNSRVYKNGEEKWQLARMCLKLLEKFLCQYDPQPSDFPKRQQPSELNLPPGFHVMLQLSTKSDFLILLLSLIDEGNRLFEQHVAIPGQKYLEDCILSCLNIIDHGLSLQSKFSSLISSSSYPVIITHLSKLLLVINPRSERPDHCLNIAKFVGYQLTMPKHSLAAVKIFIKLTSSSFIHGQLMNIMLSSDTGSVLIKCGFVECLDAIPNGNEYEVATVTKEEILKLLKQCLSYSSPNLSHFLFGFDLKRDISQTVFQLPGVLDFPRSCIHSLFSILRSSVSKESRTSTSTLAESAYHMLYMLCAHHKTSEPVLKFIKLHPKFFNEHLKFCSANMNESLSELNQLSWLLKTIAIELKVSCYSNHLMYVKQLINLLVGVPILDPQNRIDSFSSKNNSLTDGPGSSFSIAAEGENMLVQLITKMQFSANEVVSPRWEYFDNVVLENLLTSCQTSVMPNLIDIKKLHHVLIDELTSLQGSAAIGQREAILREIQKILTHALNINNARSAAAGIVKFVDAWRQVVEVFTLTTPLDILPAVKQQILDIDIIKVLLKKILKVPLLPEVSVYLSGAILLLLENIKRCHLKEDPRAISRVDNTELFTDVMEEYYLSLKEIMASLVEWIMISDVTAQKLRINLYACLVTFLQLISLDDPKLNVYTEDSSYVSRLDSSRIRIQQSAQKIHLRADIFSGLGEKLIEVICHDCTGAHDICKMLALTSFSLLIGLSGVVKWIAYMSGRGYLKHIIESILASDDNLRNVLEPVPENFRHLYLYKARIALLARFATTRVGAELLLEQRILSCLSSMKMFEHHPEILKESQMSDDMVKEIVPTVEHRYLQMFFPTLSLCNAILTSLGTDNKSAVVQVMYYLISHLEIIELVLRSGSPNLALLFLNELALLTSIISRTATNDLLLILDTKEGVQNNRTHLHRIQKLMLSLLAKFLLSENVVRDLLSNPAQKNMTYQTSERLLYGFQIVANLMLYCRNLIANHGIEHSSVGIIFQPSLSDALNNFNSKHYSNYNDNMPPIGVVVQHLINSVSHYHQEKVTYDFLQRKMQEIPEMHSTDLKDFVECPHTHNISVIRQTVLKSITDKFIKKKKEVAYCAYVVDHTLYLIWAHLDYYMLRAIPKAKTQGFLNTSRNLSMDSTLASTSEATWKVSTDDISNLKQGLVSIFNDSFSRQLLETTQERSDADKGLIEALLRKIKRLIQFVPVK